MEQKIEKVEDPADYKGGDSMGYYYEVGDLMIDTMAGKSTSHNGFGILLTPDNVDSEIEHRRTELAQWKAYYEANGTLPFRGMEDTGSLIPKIYG